MPDIIFTRSLLKPEEMYGPLKLAGSSEPSVGLCYLAAATRQAGFETEIIDAVALNLDCQQLAEQILEKRPKYLGITSVTLSINNTGRLARLIKQKDKDIKIIVGGIHITAVPFETMAKFADIDIGVLGEGELTIVELLKALERNDNLEEVSGIIFRHKDRLIITGPRQLIPDLDTLPQPAWDLLPELNRYYKPPAWSMNRSCSGLLILSRGCAARCIYCDKGGFGNRVRFHSVDYIIDMIKNLYYKFGIRHFRINDDNFILYKPFIRELCRRLIDERLGITWSCFARADGVTPQILHLMKQAGCQQISYGVESGSQRIHDLEGKRITIENIERGIRWTRQAGIRTAGFTMIGHPGETIETIRTTIDFCKRLYLDDFKMVFLTPYPGTELYHKADEFGRLDRDWNKMNAYLKPCFIPYGLTERQLIKYRSLAYRKFYLRPRIIFSYLRQINKPRQLWSFLRGAFSLLKLWLGGS